jgi:hypothetical protein
MLIVFVGGESGVMVPSALSKTDVFGYFPRIGATVSRSRLFAVAAVKIDIASIAAVLTTSLVITLTLSFQPGKLAAAKPGNLFGEP